jgi:phage anti-repressor protein
MNKPFTAKEKGTTMEPKYDFYQVSIKAAKCIRFYAKGDPGKKIKYFTVAIEKSKGKIQVVDLGFIGRN